MPWTGGIDYRPSETSAGPIRGVRRSPRAHLSRGANSGRHEHAVRQQSADPSVNPSSTTSLVLAPRNSMPWLRPSVPIEITPELVGDDLAPLWAKTWGDCYACVCAGVACERAGGDLRCRRCQGHHGQPCDADMRDKRDDEDRSPDFDRLMEAEAKAISETKGIHSGKELPAPRMGDASETASKANTFLPGLKRAGRLNAIVDFVASASRFKLIVPRENVRLTFVLAGIRAPKTARNASEKDEPFGRDGLDFSTLRALQRDVEIEVFSTDKVGGFIGALYLNKSENLAVNLVQNGLATVHGYSAEATPFYKQLLDAEEKAKVGRLGLWHDAVAEEAEYAAAGSDGAVAPTSAGVTRGSGGAAWGATANGGGGGAAATAMAPARTEYVDCIISDVRGSSGPDDPFGFSIQILNDEIQQLETLMEEFSLHHKTPTATLTSFIPRAGDLVSAKFSQDGAWYRAIIRKVSPVLKEAQVSFIDYGNKESVKFKDLRPLDSAKFGRTRLPPQAKDARLSFVRLYDGKQAEYVEEALDRFRAIASEGSKMIANIDYVEPGTNVLHLSLYDPESPEIGKSPEQGCINYELTKEGHALLDDKVRYWKSYPRMTQALQRGIEAAKTRHRGCFEYGDPTEED
ncbi:uncharacterized protein MEPE_01710 [Melanopsichium pennsylvanicum]|uniref:Uncharacterized protein n=1 Tax=Melanopsichium pennsylvanicum TaxID=63383 RepID=A0AAJ4XI33_9BASI|nr:uncharacterized protein MEPE_01710 [Melanopsichium pennsylvanicum]